MVNLSPLQDGGLASTLGADGNSHSSEVPEESGLMCTISLVASSFFSLSL